MWPYVWIAFMLGLVIATTVVAMREKKARTAAIKKMTPQPLDSTATSMPIASAADGFGDQDPLSSFGGATDMAAFDDNSFK